MSEDLTFRMGEYPARIAGEVLYATNHMWVEAEGSERRCGFTAYAVRLLQDVYFLEWTVDARQTLAFRQQIGMIESSKAEAELYAPFAGAITAFNEKLLEDPSAINLETYGAGWLFQMQADFSAALSPAKYIELLGSVWEETQRTIKGQLND